MSDTTNVIRALAMDAVEQAKSGHPGMPMGMAEIAEVLWRRHLRHHPAVPNWPDRDRFVVSNGHGSMLLYALLHLSGYDLPIGELKRFRQLHSKTPGHPEYGITPGVETTTGPLGQGIANAVGMALAEKMLAQEFNRPGLDIVNHYTYVFMGDGCMMEGISHEVCSFAGTHQLGKLICFYDDNGISIDGHVQGWFTDDTPKRFEAYGWHVIPNVDGHNAEAIDAAIIAAKAQTQKPSLICCKTVIAKGAPNKAGTHDAHGAPLGEKEIAATRASIGWAHAPFEVPKAVYEAWNARAKGAELVKAWNEKLATYARAHPQETGQFTRRIEGGLPSDFRDRMRELIDQINAKAETIATRNASKNALTALVPLLPELVGGSADLTGSNLTQVASSVTLTPSARGNHINFGVREFGMSALTNGIALHGGYIPYSGTFLTFSDYSRNALRMAALMQLRNIFVFTHDSIGLGEDGPTHQAVEHAASLRLIPNMDVWRPCDTVETMVAWHAALQRKNGPSSLLLTRQAVAFQPRSAQQLADIARGGYVLADAANPAVILIATGSEVGLAMDAKKALEGQGIAARVVSMPSTDVFDRQEPNYKQSVLPLGVRRVAIEAGVSDCWRKYVGLEGAVVGIDRFGESAPAGELFKHFGFTVDNVVRTAKLVLGKV